MAFLSRHLSFDFSPWETFPMHQFYLEHMDGSDLGFLVHVHPLPGSAGCRPPGSPQNGDVTTSCCPSKGHRAGTVPCRVTLPMGQSYLNAASPAHSQLSPFSTLTRDKCQNHLMEHPTLLPFRNPTQVRKLGSCSPLTHWGLRFIYFLISQFLISPELEEVLTLPKSC